MAEIYRLAFEKVDTYTKETKEISDKLVSISTASPHDVYKYTAISIHKLGEFLYRLYESELNKKSKIILGSPGIGKSTIIMEFAKMLRERFREHVEKMVEVCKEQEKVLTGDDLYACKMYRSIKEALDKGLEIKLYYFTIEIVRRPELVIRVLRNVHVREDGTIEYVEEIPFIVIDLRLTELEPPELVGLPHLKELEGVTIRVGKVSAYAPNEWALLLAYCPGLLILDEYMNEIRPEMIHASYKILWNKMVGIVKFNPLVMVIALGNPHIWNPILARAQRMGFVPPEVNRVAVFWAMPSTVEEWVKYMEKKWGRFANSDLLSFLLAYKQFMMAIPEDITEKEDVYRYAIVNLDEFKELGEDIEKYPIVSKLTYENFPTPRSLEQLALALGPDPIRRFGVWKEGKLDIEETVKNIITVIRGYVGYVPRGSRGNEFIPYFLTWLATVYTQSHAVIPLLLVPTFPEIAKSREEVERLWKSYVEFVDKTTELYKSILHGMYEKLASVKRELADVMSKVLEKLYQVPREVPAPEKLVHVLIHIYFKILDTMIYAPSVKDGLIELLKPFKGPLTNVRTVAEFFAPYFYPEKKPPTEEDVKALETMINESTRKLHDIALIIWSELVQMLIGKKPEELTPEDIDKLKPKVQEFIKSFPMKFDLYKRVVEEKKLITKVEWRVFVNLSALGDAMIYLLSEKGMSQLELIWRERLAEKMKELFIAGQREPIIKLSMLTPRLVEVLKKALTLT